MIEDGQHDGVRIGPPRRGESQSRSLTIPLWGAVTYAEGPGEAPIRDGRSGTWRKNTPEPSARTGSYQRSCISGGPTASSRWNFRRSRQNGSPRISSRCAGLRASTASRSRASFTTRPFDVRPSPAALTTTVRLEQVRAGGVVKSRRRKRSSDSVCRSRQSRSGVRRRPPREVWQQSFALSLPLFGLAKPTISRAGPRGCDLDHTGDERIPSGGGIEIVTPGPAPQAPEVYDQSTAWRMTRSCGRC